MYKDKYQSEYFGEIILVATQELIEHIWSPTKTERLLACNAWLGVLSSYFQIDTPELIFIEGNEGNVLYKETGGGQMFSDPTTGAKKIYMYKKFSITTLLHEFRHVMQYSGLVQIAENQDAETGIPVMFDPEEDAREWSCSLYFCTDPDRYMRAVTKGLLRYC